ncbi:MAG: hypothetical protein JST43_04080 [Bacteroidetes bacterium]|nr:hypothetical protein [Bacteroidota bacterium]
MPTKSFELPNNIFLGVPLGPVGFGSRYPLQVRPAHIHPLAGFPLLSLTPYR